MIRDAGKLHQTILALTKSDLVTSEIGQVENIFDRTLRQSEEIEHFKSLAGCVAVANCDCTDSISLAEADSVERHIFEAMLKYPADAFAPKEVQEDLQQNMGSRQLLLKLDAMFHNYIMHHWKSAALHNLEAVTLKVHFKNMCQDLRRVHLGLDDLGSLATQLTAETWGSLEWAEHMAALHSLVMEQVTPTALLEAVTPIVLAAFDAEFNKNSGTVSDLKPNRFSGLRARLMSELLPLRLEQTVKDSCTGNHRDGAWLTGRAPHSCTRQPWVWWSCHHG